MAWSVVSADAAVPTAAGPVPGLNAGPISVSGVTLRDSTGIAIDELAPLQRCLLDLQVAHTGGFNRVDSIRVTLSMRSRTGVDTLAWKEARFSWRRGGVPAWSRDYPGGSSWAINAGQCWIDSNLTTTTPQLVRFAVRTSEIARASGDWEALAEVYGTGAIVPGTAKLGSITISKRMVFDPLPSVIEYAPDRPGADNVPLADPAAGAFPVAFVSNVDGELQGMATPMIGVVDPDYSVLAGWPDYDLRYSISGANPSNLEGSFNKLKKVAANTAERPQSESLALFANYDAALRDQAYTGLLLLRLEAGNSIFSTRVVTMRGVVANRGLAVDSAFARVYPNDVVAGTPNQRFETRVYCWSDTSSTGVNAVRVAVPTSYSNRRVLAVRVDSAPVAFVDRSAPGWIAVGLDSTRTGAHSIDIDFTADVPTAADPLGSDFVVTVDDTTSALPAQPATPMDSANQTGEGAWRVRIRPDVAAQLAIVPAVVTLSVGAELPFFATVTDRFGNEVEASPTFTSTGGAGTVDPVTGVFTATTAGSSRVIAKSGGFADTALVIVLDHTSHLVVEDVVQSAVALRPGDPASEILRFRIRNLGSAPETLLTIGIENASVGPGTADQLDSEWTDLSLRIEAGGGGGSSVVPLGVAHGAFDSGHRADFSPPGGALAPNDTISVSVWGTAARESRDGDRLDVRLAGSDPLIFAGRSPYDLRGSSNPPGQFPVDGMTAMQIETPRAVPAGVAVGASRVLAFDVRVPANGYRPDTLRAVGVRNLGSAVEGSDLAAVEAWVDDGNGEFDALSDAHLGTLTFTGDRWQRSGLAAVIPVGGRRMFVTIDLAANAQAGRTVRLSLPSGVVPGLGMASGNSGPLDRSVDGVVEQLLTTADRITLLATRIPAGTVRPADREVPLLALLVSNSYAAPRRLTELNVTHGTGGGGAAHDGDFARLALRLDANDNGVLDDETTDPVVTRSAFVQGLGRFGPLDLVVVANRSTRLFVTADVSTRSATDGEILTASVASLADFGFDVPTVVAASWPVTSEAAWRVDGMVAAQVMNLGAAGLSLGADDGPIPVLDVIVPGNGHQADLLRGLRVSNQGSADERDLTELHLWADDGDGVFRADGTDADLGPLFRSGGEWQSPSLAHPVPAFGSRLFVTVRVARPPRDSMTVRMAIPPDGIAMESGNDGPVDLPIVNPATQLLSTGPLLATGTFDPPSSTPGQAVTLRVLVRNVGSETIDGVTLSPPAWSGDGALSLPATPAPASAVLAPGDSVTFEYSGVATGPGSAWAQVAASGTREPSGTETRSLSATSSTHRIYSQADSLGLFATQSMPISVSRGQSGVIPLALTFTNQAAAGTSPTVVRGFRLRLEAESGAGIVPASLLSRVSVFEGGISYLDRTVLEASGDEIDLTLSRPIQVDPGSAVTLALRLDISPATTAASFRTVIPDSNVFLAEDSNRGAPVRVVLAGDTYPLRSGLARVLAGASQCRVEGADEPARSAGQGQGDVPLLRLQFESPGIAGVTSDLRLLRFAIQFRDSAGLPAPVTRYLSRLRVRSPLGIVLDDPVAGADSANLVLAPAALVTLPPAQQVEILVSGDIAVDAPPGRFHVVFGDPADCEARDAITGGMIPVSPDAASLSGDTTLVERPATTMVLGGRPGFPALASIGSIGVRAMVLSLEHPGDPATAGIQLDSLRIGVRDATRRPVVVGDFVRRVRAVRAGVSVGTATGASAVNGTLVIPIAGGVQAAGRIDSLDLEVDFESSAPEGTIEIVVQPDGVRARDANLGTAVTVTPDDAGSDEYSSGLLRLVPPARTLHVDLADRMPAVLPPDVRDIPVARITLRNPAAEGSGSIEVSRITLRAVDRDSVATAIGRAAGRIVLAVDGTVLASTADLGADSVAASIVVNPPFEIPAGAAREIEVRLRTRTDPGVGTVRLMLDDAGVEVVQPASALLAIGIVPEAGRSFPLSTSTGSFTGASLAASYTSFPNPFHPGSQSATIGYFLPGPARVTLRIWTLRGERVRTLLEDQPVPAGLRQSESWDGRNGEGRWVVSGVYYAELVTTDAAGVRTRLLRKVAVAR